MGMKWLWNSYETYIHGLEHKFYRRLLRSFMCNLTRGPLTAWLLCTSVRGHLCGRLRAAAPFLPALPGVTDPLKCTEHYAHHWSCDQQTKRGRTPNMIPPHCPSVCKWEHGAYMGMEEPEPTAHSLSCRPFAVETRIYISGCSTNHGQMVNMSWDVIFGQVLLIQKNERKDLLVFYHSTLPPQLIARFYLFSLKDKKW